MSRAPCSTRMTSRRGSRSWRGLPSAGVSAGESSVFSRTSGNRRATARLVSKERDTAVDDTGHEGTDADAHGLPFRAECLALPSPGVGRHFQWLAGLQTVDEQGLVCSFRDRLSLRFA